MNLGDLNNGQARILVVGNHPAVNVSLRTMLSFTQLHVVATDDLEIAISLMSGSLGRIALILLDVTIVNEDPLVVSERLREIQPGINILFFSSLIDGEVIRLGIIDPERNVVRREGIIAAIEEALHSAARPNGGLKTLTAGG